MMVFWLLFLGRILINMGFFFCFPTSVCVIEFCGLILDLQSIFVDGVWLLVSGYDLVSGVLWVD